MSGAQAARCLICAVALILATSAAIVALSARTCTAAALPTTERAVLIAIALVAIRGFTLALADGHNPGKSARWVGAAVVLTVAWYIVASLDCLAATS